MTVDEVYEKLNSFKFLKKAPSNKLGYIYHTKTTKKLKVSIMISEKHNRLFIHYGSVIGGCSFPLDEIKSIFIDPMFDELMFMTNSKSCVFIYLKEEQ